MPDPLVLYSTNTLLAYRINQRYYREVHFVWCTPFFNTGSVSAIDVPMPPSSTPCDICRTYMDDVIRQDRNSSRIQGNQAGLKRGMVAKKEEGILSEAQYRELDEIVSGASLDDFRPLLYVIPYQEVADLVRPASSRERAHPFSPEYVIERLPRSRFDVLEWSWR